MTKRLFLAIDLPETMKDELIDWQKNLDDKLNVRWVPRDNLHITIVFLGEVDEEKIGELVNKLKNELSGRRKFVLKFDRVIWSLERWESGMIWAEFTSSREFDDLVEASRSVAEEFVGFDRHRKQIPHVTLARFKEPLKKIDLSQPDIKQKEFGVAGLNLVESELTAERPYYKKIFSFSFRDKVI